MMAHHGHRGVSGYSTETPWISKFRSEPILPQVTTVLPDASACSKSILGGESRKLTLDDRRVVFREKRMPKLNFSVGS